MLYQTLFLLLALHALQPATCSLGHLYAVTSNGTTNEDNFIDVNLDTWEVSVGPTLPATYDTFGQAAAVVDGVYWTYNMGETYNAALTGIDVTTRSIAFDVNVSQWKFGGPFFFDSIFAAQDGHSLLVVGSFGSRDPDIVILYSIATPKTNPVSTFLGNVTCPGYCEDGAFDPVTNTLYLTSGATDTSSGNLVAISLGGANGPSVTSTTPLSDFFDFKQWDSASSGLFGLTLWTADSGNMARNVTRLKGSSFAPTSQGPIGDGLFVVLEDGPKAFDPATQRGFYMLANGPFGEFDVVALNLSTSPPQILETPGLCGFIGCECAFFFSIAYALPSLYPHALFYPTALHAPLLLTDCPMAFVFSP